jgi:hypothetical protein
MAVGSPQHVGPAADMALPAPRLPVSPQRAGQRPAVRARRGVPGSDDRRLRRQLRRRRRSSWPAVTCASPATTSGSRGRGARLGGPPSARRLTPLVGVARATELIFTGRAVGAEEAGPIALVHDALPADDEAEAAALRLATSPRAHRRRRDPEGRLSRTRARRNLLKPEVQLERADATAPGTRRRRTR